MVSRRSPSQISRARGLRQVDNTAEGRLWLRLKNRQFHGVKFRRQEPIGPYFTDFASWERRLVVEIDGSQHIDSSLDETRNAFMISEGWSVARFSYADVLNDMDTVLETLSAIIDGRITESVVSREFQFYPSGSPSPGPSGHPLPARARDEGRDTAHMARAVELARRQLGRTVPNPPVGCVIVKDDIVIAEAATGDGGRPHAEEAALALLGNRAEGATAYVTLEPCAERSHGGLSCSQRLVEAGVSRVVFACDDPSPYAAHIGTARMTEGGVTVEAGLMAAEASVLIEDFVKNLPVKP
ncbi:DUF559 domain-containing protein [Asticcacaulis sp. AND118]|uniref:DUF559 domain-containing protein n=1 Tax=Asticcacaulis sp. AND118 TaxID=2840468 RepID=UPI001CFFA418|nr:DUF559 domain-containing protein [Asticcacaulis sp. AND118]UDF04276.1 DUF559 domain-containing protein [Asticcacaulis sp. AND118]